MRFEIMGDGPVAAWMAAALAEQGRQVSLHTTHPAGVSLRPLLIRASVVAQLRTFLKSVGVSDSFLAEATSPEDLEGGISSLLRFRFPGAEKDRWVSSSLLTRTLTDLARSLGVTVAQGPSLPEPRPQAADVNGVSVVSLHDVERSRVLHWKALPGDPSQFSQKKAKFWHITEIYFVLTNEESEACDRSSLVWLNGGVGSLEPHPEGGSVLTLVAHSRYAIEQAIRSLGQRRGRAPRHWQLLNHLNPSAIRRDDQVPVRAHRVEIEGAFAFGRSWGTLSPLFAASVSESFRQAFRLMEGLSQGLSAGSWNELERRRFEGLQTRALLWERCFASEKIRGNVLTMASWLPNSWREYLNSPV